MRIVDNQRLYVIIWYSRKSLTSWQGMIMTESIKNIENLLRSFKFFYAIQQPTFENRPNIW